MNRTYLQMPDTNLIKGYYKQLRGDKYYLAVKTEEGWKRISAWRRKEEMEGDIISFIDDLIPFKAESQHVEMNQKCIDDINDTIVIRKRHIQLIEDFPVNFYYEDRKWGRVKPTQRSVKEFHIYKWNINFHVFATVYDFTADATYLEAVSLRANLSQMVKDVEYYKKKLMDEQTPMGLSPDLMESSLESKLASATITDVGDDYMQVLKMESRVNSENPNPEEWVLPTGDYEKLQTAYEKFFNELFIDTP